MEFTASNLAKLVEGKEKKASTFECPLGKRNLTLFSIFFRPLAVEGKSWISGRNAEDSRKVSRRSCNKQTLSISSKTKGQYWLSRGGETSSSFDTILKFAQHPGDAKVASRTHSNEEDESERNFHFRFFPFSTTPLNPFFPFVDALQSIAQSNVSSRNPFPYTTKATREMRCCARTHSCMSRGIFFREWTTKPSKEEKAKKKRAAVKKSKHMLDVCLKWFVGALCKLSNGNLKWRSIFNSISHPKRLPKEEAATGSPHSISHRWKDKNRELILFEAIVEAENLSYFL